MPVTLDHTIEEIVDDITRREFIAGGISLAALLAPAPATKNSVGDGRPPHVRHADRIWVLEGGVVAESGTHDELVDAGGLYAALWRVQTGDAAHTAHS